MSYDLSVNVQTAYHVDVAVGHSHGVRHRHLRTQQQNTVAGAKLQG
jgi:hypothetical protein